MKHLTTSIAALAVLLSAGAAPAAEPGAFVKEHYKTPLADVCPNPFIIQKDWLAQAEHGYLYQMIGAGGEMSVGKYSGPLGSTGIDLVILEGGGGIGMGDGETAYSALYLGNSKAGLTPHLGFQELDSAFIYSKRFPVVGVVSPLDKSPQSLMWDKGTYPDGFKTIDDLIAFGESGKGKIYVSTIKRTFGQFLARSGISPDAFVEGYRGDGEAFVTNNGTWLQQGFVTFELHKFATGNNWAKPMDYLLISDLGYPIYAGMLSVATNRMDELAPCLEKLVPIIQQAQIDYVTNPAEVNELIYKFNDAGNGTGWWKTPLDLMEYGSATLVKAGIVSNGSNATIGDFDMGRVSKVYEIVKDDLDDRADADVTPESVVTNRFIDPSIGLK